MDRINQVLGNREYQRHIKKIADLEKDRCFCGHDIVHFMNVARIAYILNLEYGMNLDKELIYCTALLHDVGRDVEYIEGIPHEVASVAITEDILKETGFDRESSVAILTAIRNHRNETIKDERTLSGIIYSADKMSRECFECSASNECNWKGKKKNERIHY